MRHTHANMQHHSQCWYGLLHNVRCHRRLSCDVLHVQDLAHTVRTRLAEQRRFEAPKRPPHSFSVDHYAGKVTYSTLLLMDKNKDFVIAEHAALLKASGFQFAR